MFIKCVHVGIAEVNTVVSFFLIQYDNTRVQLSDNGVVSIETPFASAGSKSFPVQQLLIAPYWDDIYMKKQGQILYKVFSSGSVLEQVSDFVASHVTDFEASWALVARWEDVCLYLDNDCLDNQIGVSERHAHFSAKFSSVLESMLM